MSKFPPTGMCDIIGAQKHKFIQPSGKTDGMVVKGYLDEWGRPKCDMVLGTGQLFTYVTAVIDTGAYDTHVSEELAKRLHAVSVSEEKHTNAIYGDIPMQAYELIYGFKEMNDVYFKSEVYGMNFDAEMLIGTHFLLEFCDLHIHRKERRFELIFN